MIVKYFLCLMLDKYFHLRMYSTHPATAPTDQTSSRSPPEVAEIILSFHINLHSISQKDIYLISKQISLAMQLLRTTELESVSIDNSNNPDSALQ